MVSHVLSLFQVLVNGLTFVILPGYTVVDTDRLNYDSSIRGYHGGMSDVGLFFVRLPTLNQAEVIHAGWAHRDRQNLSLLDACQADTRDALLLDVVEIKAYLTGATSGGKGPSSADRARKQHEAEVRRARSTGKEMFSFPDGLLIDAGSSHSLTQTTFAEKEGL